MGKDGSKKRGLGGASVMDVMNQLYDLFRSLNKDGSSDINLPEIVVCGSQSSGKTSVLEAIVGEEFLPRGIDIQTRCPIVLQLIHTEEEKYVEFPHLPNRPRYTIMNDVKNVVQEHSDKIARSNKIVTKDPITIKIYSPDVVDLTLVDLPGLVENAVEGQPPELVEEINKLVKNYISNPNSIILAVTAANADIADSKSIRMARSVDASGARTLGVLTKLDLMDEGTDATDILENKKIPLKLGMIGVVNRSFKDTREGKTVAEGLEKEREFLNNRYRKIASKHGSQVLVQRISSLLVARISETLPKLKVHISEYLADYNKQLKEIGGEITLSSKHKTFVDMINKFCAKYLGQVDGRRRNLDVNEQSTAPKIRAIFDNKFITELRKLEPATEFTNETIKHAIENAHGLHNLKFGIDDAFQELAKRGIIKLEPIIMECAKLVFDELIHAVKKCLDGDSEKRFPKLSNNIELVATQLITESYEGCCQYLEDYLNAEKSIAKTSKPEFKRMVDGVNRSSSVDVKDQSPKKKKGSDTSDSSDDSDDDAPMPSGNHAFSQEVEKIRKLIRCYFNLVKLDVQDHVPKAIAYKLVYAVVDNLSGTLTVKLALAATNNIDEIMQEATTVVKHREQLTGKVKVYTEASKIIDTILQTAEY